MGALMPAVPLARVARLRALVYAFVWLDVLALTSWIAPHGDVPGELYQPLAVGRLLPLPTPTGGLVTALQVGLLVAAAVAASGRLPRLAGTAVALLYFEWMVVAMSYGKVDHDRFAFLVALAVLPTVGRAGWHDRTEDERAGWAVRCVQLGVVATYFLAVIAKHRYGGGLLTWVDSTTLLRAVVRRGTAIADWTVDVPIVLHAYQYVLVAFELASPVLLLQHRRIGRLFLAVAAAFHVVTFAAIRIGFWPHTLCLAAFLPLERLRLPERLPRRAAPGSAALVR